MSLNLLTTLPKKRIEMQIICRGVDGIKVQLWEPIARYRARLSENGLRGRIEMALLLGKPFCVKKVSSFLYSRPHLLFHKTRTHLGGGRVPPPRYLAPERDKASRQRPADSLGRSKPNGVRVDLFRSTVDLPGQVKKENRKFSLMKYQTKKVAFLGTSISLSFSQ